ncbi:hypothetical protein V495_03001 [Pseudogymnoascus sp. VKM F-4514 (FW-929)]|nr:hypothetical protein V495_03001 [Pseudogymnoascus sp. VKM F-4514 (FW-929)]KFY56390.1 hypothetical protein V497_06314 [Pseudogymnoascus sp. VKM F-4516 (FW-969)]
MRGLLTFASVLPLSLAAAVLRDVSDDARLQKPGALLERAACTGPTASKPSKYWLDEQDHTGDARGIAPFSGNSDTYPVFRNVLDFKVANDGTGDQTSGLQDAMNSDGNGGSRYQNGLTTKPAEVYLPGGTYQIHKTWDLRVGTIIVGDPNDPPVIKASSDFDGDIVVNGNDFGTGAPETSFMTLLKNVVIDTTAVDKSKALTALNWGVAQGAGMANVKIIMPEDSTGHTGIVLKGGSTIAVADVNIHGGAVGIQNSNQQVNFKNIYFNRSSTAYSGTGGWTSLLQGVTFDTCGHGVDLTIEGTAGSLVLLDSKSINSGPVVKFTDSSNTNGDRNNQIVIENLQHDNDNPIAVKSDDSVALAAAPTIDTWVWGNADPNGYQTGTQYKTVRPDALLKDGAYFTKDAPTYGEFASDQVVNVKSVADHPVKGDGKTDDAASLNAILLDNAANCKITYFPYGVYIVQDTLYIPPGSRIIGEAWAVVSGAGDKFKDASKPTAVVQVGKDGETGVAEIQDVRFTVSEVLPGAIILEVNMAGAPGDVGFWNTIVTIGGTADTAIHESCTDQDTSTCKAAFLAVHLTASSSSYFQNLWAWTADHNVDGGPNQIIATGRGVLVEATKGTWLVGTGSEHHWLYNYNFGAAQNVFAGLLQTETPYNQGYDATLTLPDPWTAEAQYHDPDYTWCDPDDQKCRTALAVNVDGGKDIFLYNSASWAFFHGPWDGSYSKTACDGTCQTNMNRVANAPDNLAWYAINIKSADTLVFDGKGNPSKVNNPGSWGGNLVAYRPFARNE